MNGFNDIITLNPRTDDIPEPKPYIGQVIYKEWDEITPPLYTDIPEVLKRLKLKKQGQKMMEEQNRIITLKHQLRAALTGRDDIFRTETPDDSKDLYDFDVVVTPDRETLRRQKMERALTASALYESEYREQTKAFLGDVIPAVKKEKKKLEDEIRTLQLELASIEAKYNGQIQEKARELDFLMKGCNEIAERFYKTDRGSALNGGALPCEQPDSFYWVRAALIPNSESEEKLEVIRQVIDEIENPPQALPVKKSYKGLIRDGSGSVAPFGGVIGYDNNPGGDGLKGVIKNILS